MVKGINEKMLYIFGVVNVLTIPIGKLSGPEATTCSLTYEVLVYALFPESNQRTLEEMNFLFSSDKPWAWEAEKNFKLMKQQNPHITRSGSLSAEVPDHDAEKGAVHIDQIQPEKV